MESKVIGVWEGEVMAQFLSGTQIFSLSHAFIISPLCVCGRHSGLVISVHVLNSGVSGPGSSPGQGDRVVFLGKTLYSHSASLHPYV